MGVRIPAAFAGVAVLLGAVAMTVALVAAPGPWVSGYVSEAGTAGMPLASVYQGGLLVLAVGVLLLGVSVFPVSRIVAGLLGAAGVLAGMSGAVPCSAGCPLPPYEVATVADLVHAGASILGMAALGFAMAGVAVVRAFSRRLRRLGLCAAGVTFPLAAVEALGMLVGGRGGVTSTVERVLLVVAVCWLTSSTIEVTRSGFGGSAHDQPGLRSRATAFLHEGHQHR
jgi:hypothetical protein